MAVLTPPGRGGIAVLRCAGYAAQAALLRCFRPLAGRKVSGLAAGALPAPGELAYGHLLDEDGHSLDEIILYNASRPATPGSGERPTPLFEVNCHGGSAAVQAVGDRLTRLGLEPVEADRLMELEGVGRVEREARVALRRAATPLAARILLDQLGGALAGALHRAAEDLRAGRSAAAVETLDALLARWRECGRWIARPPRVALAGRPNSGKSTLLNRLAGTDRAITSPAPGTTRDPVEAETALEGLPVRLVDTAGLRQAAGPIEREGVERARAELARADVVLYLVDAAAPHPEDDTALKSLGLRAIVAWNKVDAVQCPAEGCPSGEFRYGWSKRGAGDRLGVSALTGQGVDELVRAVLAHLGWRAPKAGEAIPFTAAQAEALAAAREDAAAGRPEVAAQLLAEWSR